MVQFRRPLPDGPFDHRLSRHPLKVENRDRYPDGPPRGCSPTAEATGLNPVKCRFDPDQPHQFARVVQLEEAPRLERGCWRFESSHGYQFGQPTGAGVRRCLESRWHPPGCEDHALDCPPVWRVNRPGRRHRFEAGWGRKVWASSAPALRQMEGEPRESVALVRSEMGPVMVWGSCPPPSARWMTQPVRLPDPPAKRCAPHGRSDRSRGHPPCRHSSVVEQRVGIAPISVRFRVVAPVHGSGKSLVAASSL